MFAVLLLFVSFYVFSLTGLFGFGADPEERHALPLVLFIYLAAMWSFFA